MSIIPKIRIIMLTKYEAPEGFENGYDEAIISPLGLFSFKPEKLFLNDQFFVDVGRKYYNLPKNLDSSIQFTTAKDVSFSSKELKRLRLFKRFVIFWKYTFKSYKPSHKVYQNYWNL